MVALAAALDFKLIMRGPLPVLSRMAGLLSQTMLAMAKSRGATSELAFSILIMASRNMTGLFHTAEGTLCATTAYVHCGTVAAAGSTSLTQSSACTRALTASSLSLNESTMLLLGSLDVLQSGGERSIPPFLGSLKKSVSSLLHLLVSSVTGVVTKVELRFAFLSEMRISFLGLQLRVVTLMLQSSGSLQGT